MRSLEDGCQVKDVGDDASINRRVGFQSSVEKTKTTPSSLPLAKNFPFGENSITVTDASWLLSVVSWRYGSLFMGDGGKREHDVASCRKTISHEI